MDCLSCHEPTGQWTIANFHESGAACTMYHDERLKGDTPEVKDLAAAAQSVGPTTRASCQFDADGGPGAKHGDLNPDLADPAATLDVHMAAQPDGAGFSCATCHSATPHRSLAGGVRLDRHIDSVVCETCHIPALALVVPWIFAIFWHVVTGQWRHHFVTTGGLWKVVAFYASGIFRGAPHPFRPSPRCKYNPLQALVYLGFAVVMSPAIWISGVILWIYGRFPEIYPDGLPILWVNAIHVAAAFLIAAFLISHLYLITTGETVLAQPRAMITGWDRHGDPDRD